MKINITITSAIKDMMTRQWSVTAIVNGKTYCYTLSDYDYNRAMAHYHRGNYPEALCILKGVK